METPSEMALKPEPEAVGEAAELEATESTHSGDPSDSGGGGGVAAVAAATQPQPQPDLINPPDLSPSISTSAAVAVTVDTEAMIEPSDFRAQLGPEPTYQTLNGRMSPGYPTTGNSSYATLTPLQPLPPISTVSDKFGAATPNVSGGGFTIMQNHPNVNVSLGSMDMSAYRYDKIGGMPSMSMNMGPTLGASPPVAVMGNNGYAPAQSLGSPYPSYSQNGLPSPKTEHKPMVISPMTPSTVSYEAYSRGLAPPATARLHSPNPVMPTTLNGLHPSHTSSPHSHAIGTSPRDRTAQLETQGTKQELEEINTKELAQKISSELKRYSIPQAVFAQRVLCRSQGTLSDLLRNPKPWSKLKSGRETFRRMWKWLQEPEFQRMSALRLAGREFQGKNKKSV